MLQWSSSILGVTNQWGIYFNTIEKAWIHFLQTLWVLYLSRHYLKIKGLITSRGRRYRWVFWSCPQIVVAKSFSGAKYHIKIGYEQKKFLCSFFMVSRANCSDLAIGPKNLGEKYFFRITKCYISLEPEIYEEFNWERYFT